MKKIVSLSIIIFLFIGALFSQEKSDVVKNIPSIGLHVGSISYLGDLRGNGGGSYFGFGSMAYGFYLEKKLGTNFGVALNGIFGKVSKSQVDNNVFLNFESSIMNFDLNFLLDLDNGESLFSPFISLGVGYLAFDPKGDLSSNGITYHYWSDGTFRNVAESSPGAETSSVIVARDYEYETPLEGRNGNSYSKSALTIPMWLGLKLKLSRKVDVKIAMAYIFTLTDYIDNVSVGGTDKLFYTSIGLQYSFMGEDKNDKFRTINFSSLFNEDSDNDGVIDNKDMCQNTPDSVKVNKEGCPLDGDKDGVPDYKDKEPNTILGASVNIEGVTITEEMMKIRAIKKDSVKTEFKVFKSTDEK